MIPEQVLKVPLPQIASSQQDAIIFDANNIQSLANEQEIFLIFYLSKDDEVNGYGTVIQLDPQSKQAAIYSDLNPEYAYLFFQNEQGQLQSLLWCIEVATRTGDGLFIAHAKSYGRGITEEDLRNHAANQTTTQPEPARKLAEEYSPPTPPEPTPPASQPPIQPRQPQPSFTQSSAPANDAAPANQPATVTTSNPTSAAVEPQAPTTTTPPANSMPASTPQTPDNFSPAQTPPQLNNADYPLQPKYTSTIEAPFAVDQVPAPTLPPASSSLPTSPQPAQPEAPSSPQPAQQSPLPAMDIPDIFASNFTQPSIDTQTPTPKQSVGRPQKQLVADQLWPVSQQDFVWAKNMSRSAISDFRDELWEKVIYQIRTNRPGLIEDWEFHGAFEKAFDAICITYDLIPALRHDILKTLLNGRVIDSLNRQRSHHH